MKALEHLDIYLDRNYDVFSAGDILEGQVVVELNEEMKMSGKYSFLFVCVNATGPEPGSAYTSSGQMQTLWRADKDVSPKQGSLVLLVPIIKGVWGLLFASIENRVQGILWLF